MSAYRKDCAKLIYFNWLSDASERKCPICGAKVGQQCSDENGYEWATKIHPARNSAYNITLTDKTNY